MLLGHLSHTFSSGTRVLIDTISAVKTCQVAFVVALILGFPKSQIFFLWCFQLPRVAIFAFRPYACEFV